METIAFDTKYAKLNKKQKEAVDTIYGPVMVIAGPGTGKTTVLTLRIANILRQTDAKPDEILALTFTESGAKAMREKLREIIGDASFRVNIFTFHGFANFMRSRYPENFEKIGGRIPASEADQIEIIEDILDGNSFRELRVSTYGVNVRGISKRIADLKKENIDFNGLLKLIEKEEADFESSNGKKEKLTKTKEVEMERKEKYFTRLKELARVFELYEEELERRALYDYEDTILGLIDALSKNKDMIFEMRESFQFVLADEHQDANGAQNEILKFFKDPDSADEPNLFVVGDDKQSIFRFQGANLENFYAFKEEFPKALKIDLEDNYRSHQGILDFAHSLIQNDGLNHTKLSAKNERTQKPLDVREYETHELELQDVAKQIKGLSSGKGTVAVLARNNGTLFEIAKYLDALEVHYALSGEQSLFDNFEYRKMMSLFDALLNPLESHRLKEALFFGFIPLPLSDVLYIEEWAKKERKKFGAAFLKGNLNLNELEDKENFLRSKETFKELCAVSRKKPLLEFLRILKERLSLMPTASSFAVFKLVFDEAQKLTLKNRSADLEAFFKYLSRIERHDLPLAIENTESKSNVTLSSIHRSKGLEYDYVFIIDATDRKFEKNGRRNDLLRIPGIGVERDLDEERRLLYVAITRAKMHVSISYSLLGLNGTSSAPTQFLDEISPDLVNTAKVDEVEEIDVLSLSPKLGMKAKDKLRELFLSRSFSVTALNNFLECPWKYFFRNLLHIPDVYEWSAMLGTACHNAIERFHRLVDKGSVPDKKVMDKIIHESVWSQSFAEKDLELAMEKATENVTAYISSFKQASEGEKVYIEENLTAPFDVDGMFEVMLSGKVDYARGQNGEINVVDFKSKKKMSRNEIMGQTKSSDGGYWRQLQFYKLLWEKARINERVATASLTFLSPERGKISTEVFELKESDKNEIEEISKNVLKEIYEFKFLDGKCEQKDCEFCKLAATIEL